MTEQPDVQVAERLIGYRFDVAGLIFELESAEEDSPEAMLRGELECAVADHFDPLLKAILKAAGGPRGELLETALDLARLRHRLERLRATLPSSPDEDAMLDGDIPADPPAEMTARSVRDRSARAFGVAAVAAPLVYGLSGLVMKRLPEAPFISLG